MPFSHGIDGIFNPGRMRSLITLQAKAVTRGASGSEQSNWTDAAVVHCAFATDAGREFMAAKAVNAEMTHLLSIRWRAGVTQSMRVKYDDPKDNTTRYFDIRAVKNPDNRRRFLALECRELVGREAQS
jgi:SPP1 family predicted phage head-tail adaptor